MLPVAVPFVAAAPSDPASLTLAWNPNPEADIAHYQVSYGTAPGVYPSMIEAGPNTTASVTGLMEGTTYYFVVSASNQAGLLSEPSAEISYQVPVTPAVPAAVIPHAGWSLTYADSQEAAGYPATAAFDGNPNTFWHTGFSAGVTPPPHEIQIDLGAVYAVAGFRYLPRQDKYLIGNIGQYEFSVSLDGSHWGSPASAGTFANSKAEKEVLFTQANARYVRLRGLTEANGEQDCNCAELNVLGSLATQAAPTLAEWLAAANLTGVNADPLATPQRDGIPNLLKYAFRMSATGPDVTVMLPGSGTAGLPFIAVDRGAAAASLRFEYVRRKNSALSYTPRKSYDLKIWQALSSTTALSVTALDSEWERVVIAEPVDPGLPICFGRVEVTIPTP